MKRTENWRISLHLTDSTILPTMWRGERIRNEVEVSSNYSFSSVDEASPD